MDDEAPPPQIGLSDSELELPRLVMAAAPLLRPPSYSDSFLVVPQQQQSQHQLKPLSVPISAIRPRFDFVWWYEKIVSLFIHISLISLFETVFFFQVIAKSEDNGLLGTIDGYVNNVADSCVAWPANVTAAVREILAVFVNSANVTAAAVVAAAGRADYNAKLQIQSWLYFGGITSLTAIMSAVAVVKKFKFHWRRVLLENVAMVSLLGIYEFIFFRTIIYDYQSLSMPEIDEHIVTILRGMCGLF